MVCSSRSLQAVTCEEKSPFSQKAWSRARFESHSTGTTISVFSGSVDAASSQASFQVPPSGCGLIKQRLRLTVDLDLGVA